jgi:hypothetical protein
MPGAAASRPTSWSPWPQQHGLADAGFTGHEHEHEHTTALGRLDGPITEDRQGMVALDEAHPEKSEGLVRLASPIWPTVSPRTAAREVSWSSTW